MSSPRPPLPFRAMPEHKMPIPWLGAFPEVMYLDTERFLRRVTAQHGTIARAEIAGQTTVLLTSPDDIETLLRHSDDASCNRAAWGRFLEPAFSGALLLMNGDEHRHHRGIMQSAFKTAPLRQYVPGMSDVIEESLNSWDLGPGETQVRGFLRMKRLTLDVANRTFLGLRDTTELARLDRAFVTLVDSTTTLVRVPIWPLLYSRGLSSRAVLRDFFERQLSDARSSDGSTLFAQVAQAKDEEGAQLGDRAVVRHMLFLLMAAHDTSASTLASIMYYLALHPEWQERLRHQSQERGHEPTDYDLLGELTEFDWVIQEALRLKPPIANVPRRLLRDLELGGYVVPAGTDVVAGVLAVHQSPLHWERPREFLPERFADQQRNKSRHLYAHLPFGGGPHVCLGKRFALLEIKLVLLHLLRRYHWRLPPGYTPRFRYAPITHPPDGLKLLLRKLPVGAKT